jgi:hypothetical protein
MKNNILNNLMVTIAILLFLPMMVFGANKKYRLLIPICIENAETASIDMRWKTSNGINSFKQSKDSYEGQYAMSWQQRLGDQNKGQYISYPLSKLNTKLDFSSYALLSSLMKTDSSDNVKVRFALKETSGEVWLQQDSAVLNNDYNRVLAILTEEHWRLYSDSTVNNKVIDFNEITEIRIYFDSEFELGTVKIFLDNLTFYPVEKEILLTKAAQDNGYVKKIASDYTFLRNISANLLATDTVSPNITELTIDAKEILSGDYISNTPLITAKVSDTNSGVATWNISVINTETDTVVMTEEGNANSVINTPVDISFQVNSVLDDGRYTVKVEVLDTDANKQTLVSNEFNVVSEFKITELGNFPNPFNPNNETTKIEYQLTKEADVDIYIFSISGEKLWQKKMSTGETGATAGYNKIEWDGINSFGEVVANGPYIAYVVAKNGSDKSVGKRKILVLK